MNKYQLGHGKNSTFINPDEALSIASLMPIIEVAEVVPPISPKVGDFVLVTYTTQHKRDLSYMGQLIGAQADKFEVKFLRARDAEKKAFVFPTKYYARHRHNGTHNFQLWHPCVQKLSNCA